MQPPTPQLPTSSDTIQLTFPRKVWESTTQSSTPTKKRLPRSNSTPASTTPNTNKTRKQGSTSPNNNSEKWGKKRSTGMDSCRNEVATRHLISLYYARVLGAPPEDEWDGHDGTISIISKDLKIPVGSRDVIRTVLERTDEAIESGGMYDGARKRGSGGQNVVITDAQEIKKICDYSEFDNLSHLEISVIINTE
jgi:hypothetical protein